MGLIDNVTMENFIWFWSLIQHNVKLVSVYCAPITIPCTEDTENKHKTETML